MQIKTLTNKLLEYVSGNLDATIARGTIHFQAGESIVLDCDGVEFTANVYRTRRCTVNQVTAKQSVDVGTTKAGLETVLKSVYPGIKWSDDVTIVYWDNVAKEPVTDVTSKYIVESPSFGVNPNPPVFDDEDEVEEPTEIEEEDKPWPSWRKAA